MPEACRKPLAARVAEACLARDLVTYGTKLSGNSQKKKQTNKKQKKTKKTKQKNKTKKQNKKTKKKKTKLQSHNKVAKSLKIPRHFPPHEYPVGKFFMTALER